MGKVVTGASVSLDGYIAGPQETGFEHLFAWYGAGDVEFPSTHPEIPFAMSAPDHAYLTNFVDGVGVTDGLAAAIERARDIAGDKDVGVNGGTIARQCLELGLLDEITLDLVPVLLGGGVPYFEHVKTAPVLLDGPTIMEGTRVTHLHYSVRKP